MARVLVHPAPRGSALAAFISRLVLTPSQLLRGELVWLGVVAFLVLVKILSLSVISVTFRSAGQASLLSWTNIVLNLITGLVGIWCGRAIGFPEAWDARVSWKQRLLLPAAIGLGLGALEIGLDLITAGTQALAVVTGQSSFNIDFPGSLLAYFGGAISVEIQYRLFSLPFLVWLISAAILRGRGLGPALWVVGALAALFEPITQGVFIFVAGGGILSPLMLAAYMLTALPSNILAVIFFRRSGLLAPLALRWGEYLIWHILYGNFLYGSFSSS